MKQSHLLLISTAFILASASACSEGELSSICVASGGCPSDAASDQNGDDTEASDSLISADGAPIDGDISQIDGDGDSTIIGDFGTACLTDDDCLSQFCIVGLEGEFICTERCSDECDEPGYACQLIEASGADLVRICYPEVFDLCKPCQQDFECGGLADRCIEVDDGTYCGADCRDSSDCPEGFSCIQTGGDMQCSPIGGICSDCFDRDTDGYGDGVGCLGSDCNDLDPTIFEGAPELCDFKDNNCDLFVDEGIDTNSDVAHCGGCNQPCDLPNAVPLCVASTCFIERCEDGFYDLDSFEPGCEYECVDEDLLIPDLPDSDYADTNCDGIDGDVSTSIFVSASNGRPDGDGSFNDPVDTIYAGIDLALASDGALTNVIVSEGAYTGVSLGGGLYAPLEIVEGVSVHGGYDAADWRRSIDNITRIGGALTAAVATDIVEATIISGLSIEADSGATASGGWGESSIALLAVSSPGLIIMDCELTAGNGGPGLEGDPGVDGTDGGVGGPGGTGTIDSGGACAGGSAPTRGLQGASACSPGGRGGNAGHSTGSGSTGGAVGSVPGGGGGGGGDEFASFPTEDGEDGDPGCTPTSTAGGCPGSTPVAGDGQDGAGGLALGNFNGAGTWSGDPGEGGGLGGDGHGGSGGGGGGGATGSCTGEWSSACDGWGGAGGGGGGAGCAGRAGDGGQAGGASIALYAISSNLTVIGGQLESRAGGRGGDGGRGAPGGRGRGGGPGGGSLCNGGDGGDGGNGTDGGDGGHGGGGAGGVSFAVLLYNSPDAVFDNAVNLNGQGGTGGTSSGNSGERGTSTTVQRVDP